MSNYISTYDVIPLEKVQIRGIIADMLDSYRQAVESGDAPKNAIYKRDYKRWMVVFDKLGEGDSYLDIGIGMGQLVNSAKRSGKFTTVRGADKKPHSGLRNIDGFEQVEIDLVQIPNPEYRADVVTCLEVLEHLSNTGLQLAIQNLLFLARKKLLITVPYNEDPLPKFHKQSFSLTRLEQLFPTGKITLISEGAYNRWALVEIDTDPNAPR